MFGHLKAKDFVNLMEGVQLPPKYRLHLDSCTECQASCKSVEAIHAELASLDSGIPEPDWLQFRSSVRDRLLSRSIQRESAVRRWTGWAMRPGMAWALSLLLIVGLTTVIILWTGGKTPSPPAFSETPSPETTSETFEAVPERALFDDLMQLGDDEQKQLQQMLSSQAGSHFR
jgi:hypothetical protein